LSKKQAPTTTEDTILGELIKIGAWHGSELKVGFQIEICPGGNKRANSMKHLKMGTQ